MSSKPEITVYGTNWCSDCRRSLRFLDKHLNPHIYVDIDQDPAGKAYVLEVNNGKQIVPTIKFRDGSILVEPSDAKLAKKIEIQNRRANSPRSIFQGLWTKRSN